MTQINDGIQKHSNKTGLKIIAIFKVRLRLIHFTNGLNELWAYNIIYMYICYTASCPYVIPQFYFIKSPNDIILDDLVQPL